ncbi:MAG TPA: glycosyltransferase family 87 protein, partial [Dongiaceae bacterium]|nr:glycosyltransferase family 87 protein [Dongiaceae bacterium]
MRHGVAAGLALASGILAFAAVMGLTGSIAAAALVALVKVAAVVWWVEKRGAVAIDPGAAPRWAAIVSGVAAVAALAQLARLAVFMIDPAQTAFSFAPSSEWERQHSCLSAYHVAAEASTGPTSIYDNALYSLPDDDPAAPRKARMLGSFKIDVFEYPPPFLLLPRALQLVTPEFLDLRALWFALSGGMLLLGLVLVARRLGPAAGTRALLLAPFVWLAVTTMSTLQKGNVQVIIVVLAMLGMLLFEKRRDAAGGALLAFAIASKIYPGLLVVWLLARRQWRAVAWTAAWGVGYCLLTLLAFGAAPFASFLDHLPRLLSGESFPAFRNPTAMAINLSIPGLLFKAELFGAPRPTFDQAKMVGSAWMVVAVAVTLFGA